MQIRQLIFDLRTPVLVAGLTLASDIDGLRANPSPNLQFTVEILSPNTATSTLVASNATWRYFKGTGNPNAGWDTANEGFLGPTWGTGTGGFGFGDGDDQTHLSDMQNGYSTIYLITKFTYPRVLDPRRLKLRIDYDDGFVAYLDGKEFARANAPGEPGAWPSSASLATASHEAARGDGGHPVETYDFAPDFPALFPHAYEGGNLVAHRLAIQGFNRTLADDDFSMIASLELEKLFTEVTESSVQLAGRVNLAGAAEVLVDDSPAALDSAGGAWAKSHPLRPGLNRLVIQARDCDGHVLASLSKDILRKGTPRLVGGELSSNASWDSANGVIELTDIVTIGAGVTLTIAEGTTILFRPGTKLLTYDGTISVSAASNSPAYLLPADGETPWGGISLYGSGASLTVKFAEIVAGKIKLADLASASLEDTVVRDYSYTVDGYHDYLLHAMNQCVLTARRSVFSRYYTMAFGGRSKLQFDDCLFESAEHDFFKPQETPPDSYARRCTFARSSVAGTDGVDTSNNATFTVDNCLFYDIPDKALSIEYSTITVKDSLVHHVGTGVAVKDDATAVLVNNTIAHSTYGIAVYHKNAGAVFANAAVTNCILWGNDTNILLRNPDDGSSSSGGTITVRSSDIGGGYTGTGNINRDPRFAHPETGDYRLNPGSPAAEKGVGDVDMGATFPSGFSRYPQVFQNPISQTVAPASNVVLRAAVFGSPPYDYQWRFNGVNIPGATSNSLKLVNFTSAREGAYQLVVSNAAGVASSAAAAVWLDSPFQIQPGAGNCGSDLRLTGPAGFSYILQTSSNLVHWIPLATNPAPTGVILWNDVGTVPGSPRFFRAASAP